MPETFLLRETMKRGLRWTSRTRTFAAFLRVLERFGDRRQGLLRVLTYHRIAEPDCAPDLDPTLLSATPPAFQEQVSFLAARYHVVGMPEVDEAVSRGTVLPPRSVLLTFDDAYRDFADTAWPILKRLDLPVTLFVPTGFPDRPDREFWWDRLHRAIRHAATDRILRVAERAFRLTTPAERTAAFRSLARHAKSLPHDELQPFVSDVCGTLGETACHNEVLGWDALRALAADGVTLCPHTRTHPLLNRLSLERARAEARESLHDLEREVGPTLPVLAYPAGGCSPELADALRHDGFRIALTTAPGINRLSRCDPLRLRRIHVGQHTSSTQLRARLLPWP